MPLLWGPVPPTPRYWNGASASSCPLRRGSLSQGRDLYGPISILSVQPGVSGCYRNEWTHGKQDVLRAQEMAISILRQDIKKGRPLFKKPVDFLPVLSRENALKSNLQQRLVAILRSLCLILNSVFFFFFILSHFFLVTSNPDASDCKVSCLPHKAAWQNFLLISSSITATIILIINKPLTPLRNKPNGKKSLLILKHM